ncbi:MAG: hypothetical protein V3575_00770, partial [Candidatus Absconditabacteria bacterium]
TALYEQIPPTVTTSQRTAGYGCSSYISHWVESWGSCGIIGNWSSSGAINCKQTNSWSPVSASCGTKKCNVTNSCNALGRCTTTETCSCDTSGCGSNAPRPAPTTATIPVVAYLNYPVSNCWDLFANNIDNCQVSVSIKGVTRQGQSIVGLSGMPVTFVSNHSNFKTNRINNTGIDALNLSSVNTSSIVGGGTNFSFTINGIKAIAPFWTTNGKLNIQLNGVDNTINSIRYKFNKIFVGSLGVIDLNNQPDDFRVGAQIILQLLVSKLSGNPKNHLISNYKSTIRLSPSQDFVIQNMTGERDLNTNPKIDFTVNYKGKNQMGDVDVFTRPIVTYTINGADITYYLTNTKDVQVEDEIVLNSGKFSPIKIVGQFQSKGKQFLTLQDKNTTNLSTVEIQSIIRKQAYSLTNGLSDNSINNGVKLKVGNVKLSSLINEISSGKIQTLIVKNGNFIFDVDLKLTKSSFGLIVFKDTNDYNLLTLNEGNIIVNSNVKSIDAIMYADGAVISADESGKVFTTNDSYRTTQLNSQLIINGSLFTKNTIGGGILGESGEYVLPGGKTTKDLDAAILYDLNYLRRSNRGCDKNSNGTCTDKGEYVEPLVIIFNSILNSNPPKGFVFE